MAIEIIREVEITNGTETRTMVIERINGKVMIWGRDNDPNSDGLVEVAGDSDSDVQDVLTGDWEIA